jgi:2-phosphosulfolactate phosphatase
MGSDDASVAHALYQQHKDNMLDFVSRSSHAQRLQGFGIMKDIEFCLETDKYAIVPYLKDGNIIA